MLHISVLSRSIHGVISAGFLSAAAIAMPASAQEAASTTTAVEHLDRVEVVGSRIRRSADTAPTQPVQTISRAEIEKTGLTSVSEILNNITASDGSGLSTTTTQTNGSDGSQNISLRGMGSTRTLVLVDGKRWATGQDGVVDLSSIPVAIIERVEVLKDGASAIYGSDAVAGVVNIVTRRNYEGAQAGLYFGQTAQGDGQRTSFDIAIGATGERSNVMLSLSRATQDAIMAGDRWISRSPYAGCEELALMPGYDMTPDQAAAGTDNEYWAYAFGGYCGSSAGHYGNFMVPGLGNRALTPGRPGTSAADFNAFTNADRYNFAPVNYLQQPSERRNVFLSGRYDITQNATAYARVSYTQRISDQQLAEVPLSVNLSGSNGPQWAMPIAANNVFNPFGTQIGTFSHRSVAIGPRNPHYDASTLASTVGIEGDFSIGERFWDFDIYAQYNENNFSQRGTGYVNLFNLRNALGPSRRNPTTGALECLNAGGAVIAGCVPYNVFGGPDLGLAAGVISRAEYDAMINYVSYTQVAKYGTDATVFGGVLSGDLFDLPGGNAGIAVGFEHRKDKLFDQPDTLVASGGSSDNFSEPTFGQTEVTEYFAEVVMPFLRDVPGARELELSAAIRKSDYSANGQVGSAWVGSDPGSPTTMKYSLRWKPFNDLLVRANWGETFRAPSVSDLYAGRGESFPQALDPCSTARIGGISAEARARCVAAGVPATGWVQPNQQLRAFVGGNPYLVPESGKNYSFGFVYSPSWADGLNVSADYWKIELDDALSSYTAQTVLNRCIIDGDSQLCNYIERNLAGEVTLVYQTNFNLDRLETAGIDLSLDYNVTSERWGRFGFNWDTTWTDYNKANGSDGVGAYNETPNWEYRSSFNASWSKGDFGLHYTARYMSDLEESSGWIWAYVKDPRINPQTGTPFAYENAWHVGSVVYHDIQLSMKTPWNAQVMLGGRNVFGKEPPILSYSFAHSFDAAYDLPGGAYWYMSYRQEF